MSKTRNDRSIESGASLPIALPYFLGKRAIRFFSISLLVHLGSIWALGHSDWLGYGLKDHWTSQEHMPVISASIALEDRRGTGNIAEQGDGMNRESDKSMKPVNVPSSTAPNKHQPSSRASYEKATGLNQSDPVGKTISQSHGYYPVGSLTRLPAPLEPIDLNVSPINNHAATDPVQVTLYIDTNGNVSQIDGPDQNENAREFYALVASRFKNARFSPGEIDGRKVNSRITITIVSEPA